MIWLTPPASVVQMMLAAVVLALPIAVHLLVRRHANRTPFPATHFVRSVSAAAVRFRRPSDGLLLILRLAIVTAAIGAAAGPVLMTGWRERAWDRRVARAVIVDTTRSVAGERARALAAQQAATAFAAREIDAGHLPEGLERALEWLASAPPARREIVVVSDFQRGSIHSTDLARVAASVGLAFVRVPDAAHSPAWPAVDFWRDARWRPSVDLDRGATAVTWSRDTQPAPAREISVSAGEPEVAERVVRAALSFGVPAGAGRPIQFVFDGGTAGADQPVRTPWMAETIARATQSPLVRDSGLPISFGERGATLVARIASPASAPATVAIVRAVVAAAAAPYADAESEPATIGDETLAVWRRPAAPVVVDSPWPGLRESTDSRWLWALVLVLLGVEGFMRRRRPPDVKDVRQEVHADAA